MPYGVGILLVYAIDVEVVRRWIGMNDLDTLDLLCYENLDEYDGHEICYDCVDTWSRILNGWKPQTD